MPITPYLYYRDVAGALRFLGKAFGFRKFGPHNRSADGRINHAAMKLGKDVVMMGWPGAQYRNPKQLGEATQCLYVNVANVEMHHAGAVKAGAKIIDELKDTFFGERRYGAEDPEGHQWYFGQTVNKKRAVRRGRAKRAATGRQREAR